MTDSNDDSERRTLTDRFQPFATAISDAAGSPWAMLAAASVVVAWLVSGPIFGFSDTWQLVINTGTTIVTFLMVFAIQASQNRSSRAMQIKLDELLRATSEARNSIIDVEEDLEDDIERDEDEMRSLGARREAKDS